MPAKKIPGKSSKKPASGSKSKGTKYVYAWGNGRADGDGSMRDLLGGKGANLGEMARIGLPVPPGFTITTEVCNYYYANKRTYPAALKAQIAAAMAERRANHGRQVRRRGATAAARSPCAPARGTRCRA